MNDSNSSVENSPPQPYNETYWIISQAILMPITLLCILYLKSLIFYLRKQRNRRNRKQLRILLLLNIVATAVALSRFISDQIVAFLGWQTDDLCFYSVSVSVELYSASFAFVYIFLWLRQYSFYSNKQLQTISNRKVLYVANGFLALLVVGWVILCVLFLLPSVTGWEYSASLEGCRDINDEQDIEILPIAVNLIAGLGQISLLALLLYPLLKYRIKHKRNNSSTSASILARANARSPSPFPNIQRDDELDDPFSPGPG